MPGPSSLTIRTFQPTDAEPLAALLRESMAAGEQAGHTTGDFEGLIGAFPIVRGLLIAELDAEPVGLICAEMRIFVVRPDVRRRGIGTALVEAMETTLESTSDGPLILFPPHGNDGALAFLTALGFEHDHSMWNFRLVPSDSRPLPPLPGDISFSTYTNDDILPYIDLVNESFLDHPAPLRVTIEQVEHVHSSPRFDPASIGLLRDETGALIGFCRTGIDRSFDPPVGNIEMLGLLKEYRGRGLGRWLVLWGIERLRSLGLQTIELGVEAENENAVGLYRSVGFEPVEEWPQWMRPS